MRECMAVAIFVCAVMFGMRLIGQLHGTADGHELEVIDATAERPAEDANEVAWAAYLGQRYGLEVEHRLPDGRRVDLMDHRNGVAYEVDWARKHSEGLGQAIEYASATDYEPGVWLLFKTGDDEAWNQSQCGVEYCQGRGVPVHFRTTVVKGE